MSREGRCLTEEKFDAIVIDLREKFEKALKVLSEEKIVGSELSLGHRIAHLEFNVVSPLYYRLQRHLIDWGTRSEHDFADSKLAKWLDERGYKYNDIIPLQYRENDGVSG